MFFRNRQSHRRTRGFTLLELFTTATVLLILAGALVPMVKHTQRREKEQELRRVLREMRQAIDTYKAYADAGRITPPPPENFGYPESLDLLVEGVNLQPKGTTVRFLRRIPVDPFTGKAEWGMRSIADEPDSTSWGGSNVFDVYSLSQGTGFNQVPYREW